MSRALDELLSILTARGQQYGTPEDPRANLNGARLFGVDPVIGCLVRGNDKWVRVQNLSRERHPDGTILIHNQEHLRQLRDNLIDIAGYAIKAVEILDERD